MTTQKKIKSKSKKQVLKPENENFVKKTTITPEIKKKAFSYYALGLTAFEVAKLLDLNPRTVQKWQTEQKWTQKLNPNSLKDKCLEMQNKGMTYVQISEILQISKSTVNRYIKEAKTATQNKVLKNAK